MWRNAVEWLAHPVSLVKLPSLPDDRPVMSNASRLVIVLTATAAIIAAIAMTRWSAHEQRIAQYEQRAAASTRLAQSYRKITDHLEARRISSNELLNRLHAAYTNARGSEGIATLVPIRDRMDAVRRGDHFEDIIDEARRTLPSSEAKALDHDFTVLLRRQEDSRDATQALSAGLSAYISNPFLGAISAGSPDKLKAREAMARKAFNAAFEVVQGDLYQRSTRAGRRAADDRAAVVAARGKSVIDAVWAP